MTFLTFRAADVFDGHGVFVAGAEVAGEFGVDAIEFIAAYAVRPFGEGDLGGAMAVDAPPHAQIGELFYLIHLLDGTMTGLALDVAYADMLRMIEIDQVGEVVDLDPFDGVTGFRISIAVRVVAAVAI
jgi:hypothetical protein